MDTNKKTDNHYNDKEGNFIAVSLFVVLILPLLLSSHWKWRCSSIILVVFIWVFRQIAKSVEAKNETKNRFIDKHASEILREIKVGNDRIMLNSALESLALKVNSKKNGYDKNKLELYCLEAIYIALTQHKSSPNDELLTGILSLAALIAKNEAIRSKCMTEKLSLKLPLEALNRSLKNAQQMNEEEISEDVEQASAEVQRRGCLWLGAFVDGNKRLATRVVDEGGLQTILAALNWYRHHEDVNNWGLWAIFMLCYENSTNQIELVRLGGLQTLCRSILNNLDHSVEVCRHGVAVFFDLLRNSNNNTSNNVYDIFKVRQVAIGAGLQDAVHSAMSKYPESVEIIGMGTELLISTGYERDIPVYKPVKEIK